MGRPYSRDTRENQLSPSYPDSLHSSHVQGTCFTSREAYSRDTRENSFSLQMLESLSLSLFLSLSLSLSHTHITLTNKSHNKYRVHKIEHIYNQIWHGIKANKNIVVNYNFTKIIYLVLQYICNNPLIEISNTIEIKILTIINNFQ